MTGSVQKRTSFGRLGFSQKKWGTRLAGGHYRLGQTGYDWYVRAKRALAKFESFVPRVDLIANKTVRDEIASWLGSKAVVDSPLYRYESVAVDVAEVDKNIDLWKQGLYVGDPYDAYLVDRRQNRVEKLEDFAEDLEDKVVDAEKIYGVLPAPEVITRTETILQERTTSLTVPILIGAGAIALALILS